MSKIKCIRGDSLNIEITDIEIELDDGSFYMLGADDRIVFSISLPRKETLLDVTFPDGQLVLSGGNKLIITFSPWQTEKLKCLCYDFDCKIDFKGQGSDIYTIAKGELQVYETATKLGGIDG